MTLHLVLPPDWPRRIEIKRAQAVTQHRANRILLLKLKPGEQRSGGKNWELSATLPLLRPRIRPPQRSDGASGLIVEDLKSSSRHAEQVLLIPSWGYEETGIEGKGTLRYPTSFWRCGYPTAFWCSELPGGHLMCYGSLGFNWVRSTEEGVLLAMDRSGVVAGGDSEAGSHWKVLQACAVPSITWRGGC